LWERARELEQGFEQEFKQGFELLFEKVVLMLSLSKLKVDIDGSRILNGISLSVAAGELVCLVGRNGAGKTTTFRSIMGYRQAVSGDITFEGADLNKLPTWQRAQTGIGFSPEESEVYADLTVAENIELSTWTRPSGRSAGARIEEATPCSRNCDSIWRAEEPSFPAASARWCRLPGHWRSIQNYCCSTNHSKACRLPSSP
jgi:ABC-type molybdenum transport system ATPase subunit/photorepair protein PhrA